MFRALPELSKGLSDLPLFIASLIFTLLYQRKKILSNWKSMFVCLAIAAILGSSVHIFNISEIIRKCVWIFTHLFIYLSIYKVNILLVRFGTQNIRPTNKENKIFILISSLFYLLTILALFFGSYQLHLFVLVGYIVVVVIPLLILSTKQTPVSKTLRIVMLMMCVLIVFQCFEEQFPYGIVIEHTLILISMFLVYRVSLKDTDSLSK